MHWSWIKPDWLIRRQAAALLVRADVDPSPENLERLERWRAAAPRQGEALAKAEAVLGMADLLAARPADQEQYAKPVRGSSARLALAASIAAVAVLLPGAFLLLSGPKGGAPLQAAVLRTGPGETREARLADGSAVTLWASSTVRVDLLKDRREAVVEKGKATFRIARDARPFRVSAGSETALTNDGVIEVVETVDDRHIRLIEGSARITRPAEPAGDRAVRAPATPPGAPAAGSLAPKRVSFDNVRLADVAAWANRAGGEQIVIADPAVAELRVTGVYGSGDASGLARSLAAAFGLEVRAARGRIGLVRGGGR